jgi:predicted nucleotide-binding protein (sugar kinase/HSP70/actin superfamily)
LEWHEYCRNSTVRPNMKIQNHSCVESIELFYSRVKFFILLCIYKHNYQNNPTQFSKRHSCPVEKTILPSKAKVKERMTKGHDNNYTIEMNSKLCLGAQ